MEKIINMRLAKELQLPLAVVEATVALLDDGNTVPFIARYRKEVTSGMDDQVLRELSEKLVKHRQLEERRAEVRRLIDEQGKLNEELEKSITAASTMSALDDIYRPFRPKRRTRATMARERGLEPLAKAIISPEQRRSEVVALAETLINEELGVADAEAALSGALDILAEDLSDDAKIRARLRALLWREGQLSSKQKQAGDSVYRLYYDYSEPLNRVKGHRTLALNRGEKEAWLQVKIDLPEDLAEQNLRAAFSVYQEKQDWIANLCADAWKRLLFPSLETEIRNQLTEEAEAEAMGLFATNLRATLLAPPLREHTVMAFDPGYRNGCKLSVTDPHGEVLATAQIYPLPPQSHIEQSRQTVDRLIKKHQVEVLALGNGTATRETEAFIRDYLKASGLDLPVILVNEAGASVYSASALAAEEFPEMDVSLRSSVSLARRLQDPLAELVKIEPAAIGVGQYQHDMNQKALAAKLGDVVEDCVNQVGCDLNTASRALLSYIAGVSPKLAANIVEYRSEHGVFRNRKQLLKVPKLGPKAFEQCAGFLRIPDSDEPLDNTSVHPESYAATKTLLKRMGLSAPKGARLSEQALLPTLGTSDLATLAAELGLGVPTLTDIISALEKPGRDSRENLDLSERSSGVQDIADLKVGMKLKGVVRNVAAFGAFVDIGVHQDGLVHISELADRFIQDPTQLVQAGQRVDVIVLDVDTGKKRIALSMKPSRLN
jgi:protein Tex